MGVQMLLSPISTIDQVNSDDLLVVINIQNMLEIDQLAFFQENFILMMWVIIFVDNGQQEGHLLHRLLLLLILF